MSTAIASGLTKEQILAADDRHVISIDCPEWGGVVFVRPLSGEARDELEERFSNSESMIGIRAWIAAAGLCDESGESMGFSPREVDQLASKSASTLDKIAAKVQAISGMTKADVEELEKNSGNGMSDDSG